ncbi:metallophosphoesterase [Rhizobiaceae bacterium BDR2-2]|uniref:Metallophosphoesterase n=1 Tax=Ectorhizobium quercum TaxID=2965071 RepID=A0AAE3SU29_9HYPH|nr:metallophosphoesterase [Ectorhizobium quercum]MCX8996607.1 metallophosphoesterase [Ectorhizobium quercum]
MFTLAHISDVHLGPLPRLTLRELASKRITGYVNWHRNRRKHLFGSTLEMILADIASRAPDHIAITGDLVNLATGTEIRKATEWLATVGAPADVSVVPGNHDAYVPGAGSRSTSAWYPYMCGDDAPAERNLGEHAFPYMRRRGPVALIGCSTAVATPPFTASGYFGPRQARDLVKLLRQAGEEGLFRIVMIHHPPIRGATTAYKRMLGIRRFAAALSLGGAELVLHGHTHLNTLHWIRLRGGGQVPVLGIASASQGPGSHRPCAAYNLLTVSGAPGAWKLACDRYGLDPRSMTIGPEHRQILIE